MGLDGGTYITRSDVLRGQSWELASADNSRSTRGGTVSSSSTFKRKKLDKNLERSTRWSTCSLTGEKLQPPIVSDFLGNLYNREAVLRFLLAQGGSFLDEAHQYWYANQVACAADAFAHLESKRDVFTVQLATGSQDGEGDGDAACAFICPVTQLPCGSAPFAAIASCGHVFSRRALRQVNENTCMTCGKPFRDPEDLVTLNGTEEEAAALREVLEVRRQAARLKGPSKKRRRVQHEQGRLAGAPLDLPLLEGCS